LQQAAEGSDEIQQHQQRDDLRQWHKHKQDRPRHQRRAKAGDAKYDIGHDDAQTDHQPIHTTKRPLTHQLNRAHGEFLVEDDHHFSHR
jgi:hypothetical protein